GSARAVDESDIGSANEKGARGRPFHFCGCGATATSCACSLLGGREILRRKPRHGGHVVTSASPAAKYPDAGLRDACDRRLSGNKPVLFCDDGSDGSRTALAAA